MNSPFANIFLEVLERLRSEVPEARYINQDVGQLDNYTDRPAVTFPCILTDFQDFNFSEMGEASQMAEGNVVIRLAFNPFSDSSNLSSDVVRTKALAYYDIEWKINKALHGWQGEAFGYLTRKSAITEKRDDNLRVREIIYATCFQDNSAGKVYEPLPEDISSFIQLQAPSGNTIDINP